MKVLAIDSGVANETEIRKQRRFWIAAASLLGVIAVGKGLRPPNAWAATQAQMDYRVGFVKRGLFGATATHAFGLQHYRQFAIFSCVSLGLFFLLLALLVAQSGLARRFTTAEVLALFFSSYAITYLAHVNGYSEIVLGCLAIALLLIRDSRIRFALSLPVCIAAVLIHELFLFAYLPVLLLRFLLDEGAGRYWRPAVIALVCGVLAFVIVSRPPLRADQLSRLQDEMVHSVDFRIHPAFFSVLSQPLVDHSREMHMMYRSLSWWKNQVSGMIVMGPTIALLIVLSLSVFDASSKSPAWLLKGFVVLASLSPLLINVFGTDLARWTTLTLLASFLVLLVVVGASAAPRLRISGEFRRLMLVAAMLNMASGGLLLDGRVVRYFPFSEGQVSTRALRPSTWAPDQPLPAGAAGRR